MSSAVAETEHQEEPNYMAVFYALGILTVTEIGVAYMGLTKAVLAPILVSLAFVKASLVALWYMHLKFEGRLLYLIVAMPLLLVCIMLAGYLPDIGYR